ncbi:hypothetical protein Plhal304r1_c018g0065581 [Plasmopara halstedii]
MHFTSIGSPTGSPEGTILKAVAASYRRYCATIASWYQDVSKITEKCLPPLIGEMAYSPEQYLANKERIKAAQKRYYQRTRDARLSYQKSYDDKNRDQIRARKRKPETELIEDKAEPYNETKLY